MHRRTATTPENLKRSAAAVLISLVAVASFAGSTAGHSDGGSIRLSPGTKLVPHPAGQRLSDFKPALDEYNARRAGPRARRSDHTWLDLAGLDAAQSSTGWGGSAARATDGIQDTNYHANSCTHTLSSTAPWWEVTLGGLTTVSAVKVTNRGDCCGSRLNGLEVTVDGQPCASGVTFAEGETKAIACDAPVTGTVVRLALPGTNRILTLCEVAIKGRALGYTPVDIALQFVDPPTDAARAAFEAAEATWEALLPEVRTPGHSGRITIEVTFPAIDGEGGTLGSALPLDWVTSGRLRTATKGQMEFDSADVDRMHGDGELDDVVMHEMGHALGLGGLWATNGLKSGHNYVGPRGLSAYRRELGLDSTATLPIEQDGEAGTAGGHVDEHFNGGVGPHGRDSEQELMTGWLDSPAYMAAFSVISLEDQGFESAVCVDDSDCGIPGEGCKLFPGCSEASEWSSCLAAECPSGYEPDARYSHGGVPGLEDDGGWPAAGGCVFDKLHCVKSCWMPNLCTPYDEVCSNGVVAAPAAREQDHHCVACDTGYRLENRRCVPAYAGSCSNGQLISNVAARTADNQCGSCNRHFNLIGTSCKKCALYRAAVSSSDECCTRRSFNDYACYSFPWWLGGGRHCGGGEKCDL